jgi:hypothetical protein
VRTQKLMWHNIMRSTKSQKVSILHYSIYIYIYEINKHANLCSLLNSNQPSFYNFIIYIVSHLLISVFKKKKKDGNEIVKVM